MRESKYKIGDRFMRQNSLGTLDCFVIDGILFSSDKTYYHIEYFGYVNEEFLSRFDLIIGEVKPEAV